MQEQQLSLFPQVSPDPGEDILELHNRRLTQANLDLSLRNKCLMARIAQLEQELSLYRPQEVKTDVN